MPGQGKRTNSTVKTLICKVYKYFKSQQNKSKGPSGSILKKTSEATGFCRSTVYRVLREQKHLGLKKFDSPVKRYVKSRKSICVDDFDVAAIRRTVHEFYNRKEYPTMTKLLAVLKEKELFSGGRTTLWKLLREIGFKYKTVDNKKYVYEQPKIILWCHKYLPRMRKNRIDKRHVVYLDETWANAHDGHTKSWVEVDASSSKTKGGVRKPSGKGNRLIILHAGSKLGWVDGSALVFQSKKSTGDYHDEMTGEHFEEWFHDNLLPKLPSNSLIVMDNASYHSRRIESVPTMSSRKAVMQDWLVAHGIVYPEKALTRELYQLIKLSNIDHKYTVDEMAKATGHEVVRLPPYHCKLNPIELAWSRVKRYIKDNNKLFTLVHVKELTFAGFSKVDPDNWKNLVEHASKVEDKFWEQDWLHEQYLDEFIINTSNSDSSDDDSSITSDSSSND